MLPSGVAIEPRISMCASIFLPALLLAALTGTHAHANDMTDQESTPADSGIASEDPFLWLEDVAGDRALTWVRRQNAASIELIGYDEGFDKLRDEIKAILYS